MQRFIYTPEKIRESPYGFCPPGSGCPPVPPGLGVGVLAAPVFIIARRACCKRKRKRITLWLVLPLCVCVCVYARVARACVLKRKRSAPLPPAGGNRQERRAYACTVCRVSCVVCCVCGDLAVCVVRSVCYYSTITIPHARCALCVVLPCVLSVSCVVCLCCACVLPVICLLVLCVSCLVSVSLFASLYDVGLCAPGFVSPYIMKEIAHCGLLRCWRSTVLPSCFASIKKSLKICKKGVDRV